MPYLLFSRRRQNFKLSSAANYRWRFKSFFFASDGMRAFLTVKECGDLRVSEHMSGNVRTVFLAAETEVWDYAPSGLNLYDGGPLIEAGKYVT